MASFINPDQELMHRFLKSGSHPIPFDANPMARALNAELHAVDLAGGRVELEFDPDPLFIQGTGVIQGGAVTAMLDFAMAFATLARLPMGASCATTTVTASFMRPAPSGRYRCVGEVEKVGRQVAFTQAQLLREADDHTHGQLVATATSTLLVLPAL